MRRILRWIIVLVVIWAVPLCLAAVAADPVVIARWLPPTEGSAVDHYVFRLFEDGDVLAVYSDIPDTFFTIPEGVIQMFKTYTADVAGVDAHDPPRQAPWSDPSSIYIWDDGAPSTASPVTWEVQPQ